MGSITSQPGVLKLVRPGRHVEVHKEPVTAEEVMRRHPRHCITRPAIFEFPWIVVKAEAVLTPGKVFCIVPNRTIYQLLKAREHDENPPPSSSQQHKKSDTDHVTCDGVTPKHHEQSRRRLKHQFFACATVSPSDEEGESEKGNQIVPQVGAWPEMSPAIRKARRREYKQQTQLDSKIGAKDGKESRYRKSKITSKLADLKLTDTKQVALLKSCLRKPESRRKLLQLKVAFALPHKDEEPVLDRHTKVTNPRPQFPDSSGR